jgi:hypothetical protein
MLEQRTLQDIIRQKIHLGPVNSRGFHDVHCQVCHDKIPRGAFRFDASSVGYTCFHCGAAARYEEGTGRLSKNFRGILYAFGITREDLMALPSSILAAPKEESAITLDSLQTSSFATPSISLPEKCFSFGVNHHEELQVPLLEYLEKRCIDPLACDARFSLDTRYRRRVIIPFYRGADIIYWQARAIDDEVVPRYLNAPVARDAIIYGYSALNAPDPTPLFVTEGVFDAITLNGICILGSSLNEVKIQLLKSSSRRIIFIIDSNTAGENLAHKALAHGWEVTMVHPGAVDANRSVQLYGLPFTVYSLLKNTTRNRIEFDLQMRLRRMST